jgi:uncharacterized coiled-coil protein SlyX
MVIKKSELMVRILDLEMLAEKYENIIDDLNKRLMKLEKSNVKKTAKKKVDKKGVNVNGL